MDDDAVDAARETSPSRSRPSADLRAGAGRGRDLPDRRGAASKPCSARRPRSLERFAGAELVERYAAYRGPIFAAERPRAGSAPDPRRRLRDDRGRHGDRAPRAGVRRGRLPRRAAAAGPFDPHERGTLYNPVRPDGRYDARVLDRDGRSYEGRFVKDPELTSELIAGPARARAAARVQRLRALLPALLALRHAAALLRQTVVVHRHLAAARRAAGGERDRRLVPAARQARALRRLAEEQRRLGALARALLGHAAARVALRGGPHPRRRLVRRARASAPGARSTDHHRPFVDEVEFACPHADDGGGVRRADAPRAGGDRRVVRLRRDAVRPAPLPVRARGRFERRFPADFICEAQDQTRGWFYSLLAVATLLDDARALQERRLPGPDPRRGGPEDVEVQGQHGRAVAGARHLRRRCVPLVLLHLQAAVGRLPLLGGDDRRGGAAVPQAAVEHLLLLRPLRARGGRSAGRRARGRRRSHETTSTAGRCRAPPPPPSSSPSAWTPTTPRRRAGRSRAWSTSSPTGTCAARGGASGTAIAAAFADAAHVPADGRQAAGAVLSVHRR